MIGIKSRLLLLLCIYSLSATAQVRIGVLTDLSGSAAYYGKATRVGSILAAGDIASAGGNLQIVFEDSALNAQRGISAAQKLLMIDKVDALYVDFTPIVRAVSPLAQRERKLMLYSAAAESVVHSNPYAFKTYLNYSTGCESIAREFKNRGVKRMGMLKTEAEYGELCSAGVGRVYDDVIELSYRQGDSVATQVLAMKSKGVEAIINGAYEGDLLNTIQAAHDINFTVRFGAAEDVFSRKLIEKYGSYLDGSISFGLKRLPAELIDRSRSLDGGQELTTFEGYGLAQLHLKQMYAAIAGCPGKDVECEIKNLQNSKPDESTGFVRFDNRVANLTTALKVFSAGSLRSIESGDTHRISAQDTRVLSQKSGLFPAMQKSALSQEIEYWQITLLPNLL